MHIAIAIISETIEFCFSQLLEPSMSGFHPYKPRQLESQLQKTLKRLSSCPSVFGDLAKAVLDSPASPTRVLQSLEYATKEAQHLHFLLGFEIVAPTPTAWGWAEPCPRENSAVGGVSSRRASGTFRAEAESSAEGPSERGGAYLASGPVRLHLHP